MLAISASALFGADTLPVPLGLDAYVPAPESNRLTREKVSVGRELFFFRGLSRDATLSCADCHQRERSFTDGRPRAIGVGGQVGPRRTPPLINRAWGRTFFWDGRAATLEDQVVQPILNPLEMGLKPGEISVRVCANNVLSAHMKAVFGREPNPEDVAHALASYVRSILSGHSPYDRYVAGDRSALTERQQLGLKLFRGKGNCVACHVGPNLTDERFHNTGSGWADGKWADEGRGDISRDETHRGAFKTPGLREVAGAAPYMHDGGLKTLEDVIEFYDKGGRENPGIDIEIRRLDLTSDEKGALVEFLKSLSGTVSEGWSASH